MDLVVFSLVLAFGLASCTLQYSSVSLHTCRDGIGLAPFLRLRDSRSGINDIVCSDGVAMTTRGIDSNIGAQLVQFEAVLRPLGKGLRRQGFALRGLFFIDMHIVLVGVCMTDVAPIRSSTIEPENNMPSNMCAGVADPASSGSPRFEPYLDETENAHVAFQLRNPPQPSTTGMANAGMSSACNFYNVASDDTVGIAAMMSVVSNVLAASNVFALTEQTGLGDYVGLANTPIGISPGCAWNAAALIGSTPLMTPQGDNAQTQHYGSLTAVLQSWVKEGFLMLTTGGDMMNGMNAHVPFIGSMFMGMDGGNVRGIVSYAGFQVAASSAAIGFQLACDVSDRDEEKWITFSFLGGITAVNPPVTADWDYNPPSTQMNMVMMPYVEVPQTNVDSQVGIKVTCQNVATDTPTPPLYPRAPSPAPWDAPYPLTAGAAGSVVVTARECSRLCQDTARQDALKVRVSQVALQVGNVGANTQILCEISPQCSEVADTATVIAAQQRRGLKQATSIAWLQIVIIVTRELGTAQYLVDQIRRGNLAPFINAFAALSIRVFDQDLRGFPQIVPPPSASSPIANWPNPQAEWTGSCQVYGNCRAGGCASSCSNEDILRVSAYSAADNIMCLCNLCGLVVGQVGASTQYFFQTFDCGTATTQTLANECCRNVMQDAICWAVHDNEVSVGDLAAISAGLWSYRPPSIGLVGPAAVRRDGPNSCPDTSSSAKGLLGLLGLLGIIPIALCLLSLLLCLLRRKKREGDVHFATFDPHTAPVGMSPCPTFPAM